MFSVFETIAFESVAGNSLIMMRIHVIDSQRVTKPS